MGARTGGSLSTVLMSIPLAAIPLMAIFGIPRFAPVVASPESVEGSDGFDLPVDLGSGEGEPSTGAASAEPWPGSGNDAPPYEPLDNQRDMTAESMGDAPASEWGDPFGHPNRPRSLDPSRPSPGTRSPETAVPEPAGQRTWRDAARRLNELGVHDFQLRPGTNPETFLFACVVSPNGDPKVVRRFESESTEPLSAVDDVLTQIEDWRHQPEPRATTPETGSLWGHADQLGHLGTRR